MDRRSYFGLISISVLLAVMFLLMGNNKKNNAQKQADYAKNLVEQQATRDSIQEAAYASAPVVDSLSALFPATNGVAENVVLRNENVEISLSTKGGMPNSARLFNYNNQQGSNVVLFDENEISLNIKIDGKNQNISTKDLYFAAVNRTENSVTMRLNTNGYGHLDFIYTLQPESYMLNLNIKSVGMANFFSTNLSNLSIDWIQNLRQQEKGFEFEQRYTTLTYKRNDKRKGKFITVTKSTRSEEIEEPLDWIAFKNQFFSCILISDKEFEANSKLTVSPYAKGKGYMKKMMAKAKAPFDPTGAEATTLQFYFGPNDYKILRESNHLVAGGKKARLHNVMDLGWPVVREFNRFLIIPLFNLLSNWGLSMGLVILIMTIILKIVVYPFTYKSYISSAKMRALKPYIDEVNMKYPKPEDAMKKQQETMAVYSKYGVSPMGGCIPSLIQMPFFMAFFFFVPNAIELRQQSFLWADDLTGFDDILSWSTNIPLIGNHLSIFCVLFCLCNIINTVFSMKQQQQQSISPEQEQSMKMMKWMMYIMPVVFFFSFNNYSSGLNYYYFISSLFSIGIMIYLRRTTDEKKLLAKLEANYEASKNDPTKRRQGNNMMARLEAMQKEQERLLQQQQKNNRK
ncbi:MAG: membrane protein insertase YidC [Bacteroidaceae bacterium]|nr:membrane protein insertase YidC [Bacteroidaceae bacterium]